MDNGQRVIASLGPLAILTIIAFCVQAVSTPPPGYKLVWSDEFHEGLNAVPNPAFWNYETGQPGINNRELQPYVSDWEHAHIVADPEATDGQALQIEASHDARGYQSARLVTANKITFQNG